jgi:hypothetical protein
MNLSPAGRELVPLITILDLARMLGPSRLASLAFVDRQDNSSLVTTTTCTILIGPGHQLIHFRSTKTRHMSR